MFYPEPGGVLTGNESCSEYNIPDKEHVAEVAFVVTNAVVVAVGVMGMMGGGCLDQSFEYPCDGMQRLIPIEGFVPGDA